MDKYALYWALYRLILMQTIFVEWNILLAGDFLLSFVLFTNVSKMYVDTSIFSGFKHIFMNVI